MAYPKATIDFTEDPGTTGNFEITVDGTKLFSKKGGDRLPHMNWEAFGNKVKNHLEA